jgi:5-methylcytosine-specific restriction endonuclease McrA
VSLLPKPRKVTLRVAKSTGKRTPIIRVADEYSRIDPETRRLVWKRDGGRCCHCGAHGNLQFDHIVPRSLGGSGIAANVELLCGNCNNRKKARVFVPKI